MKQIKHLCLNNFYSVIKINTKVQCDLYYMIIFILFNSELVYQNIIYLM